LYEKIVRTSTKNGLNHILENFGDHDRFPRPLFWLIVGMNNKEESRNGKFWKNQGKLGIDLIDLKGKQSGHSFNLENWISLQKGSREFQLSKEQICFKYLKRIS